MKNNQKNQENEGFHGQENQEIGGKMTRKPGKIPKIWLWTLVINDVNDVINDVIRH